MAIPPASDLVRLVARVSDEVIRYWDVSADRLAWYGDVGALLGAGDDAPPETLASFLERVHPDDRVSVREGLRSWIDAPHEEEWSRRYRLRDVHGEWRTVLDRSLALRDEQGRATGAVGTLQDLTRPDGGRESIGSGEGPEDAASSSEEVERGLGDDRMYRALAENASDLITVMAPDGEIRYESPSLKRIMGYEPEELVGRNAFEFIHPDDRERVQRAWQSGQDAPEGVGAVEYRCRHADGSWRYLESTGRRSPEGAEIDGILVHSRDVTERRELERRLEQSRKMETVGRLVGGIAHDFNNLMTVIAGNTEFLLDAVDETEPFHGAVTEIRDAAQRAGRLTRHLLAFGRQENLRLQEIDLAEGMRAMRSAMEETLGEDRTLDLRIEVERGTVRVDPELAQKVVLELVSNARDAMPDGGTLHIRVERIVVEPGSELAERGLKPGRWIRTAYADTGTGMNRRVEERAFEPYFSTRKGRAGLGLSMVYGLVKQSEGEVSIESTPGEGTTVWTFLPDVEAEAEEGAEEDDTSGS